MMTYDQERRMKMFNKLIKPATGLMVLVMAVCMFSAQAAAQIPQIDPDAFERVEAAVFAADLTELRAAAEAAARNGVENGMTIQEACRQIAFVTATTAEDAKASIAAAVQASVDGVSRAAKALSVRDPGRPTLELDVNACADRGFEAVLKAPPEVELPLAQDEKAASPK
jgi:hypothetical protein